eukprot:CAMPEP_0197830038 /NCGR_PEP_ID=MMETSP1437-20131217/6621_1 /TAXON_ID=49252 ORGANISM="Eucampia antarctica, Strain CCMP1452" /NCGR_SAMPLE_ID=MMETSP1437 /ASSEMBLY_ACC=CAM_ASM_001096 /LENGTH=541 /DNA_ID=CAMNT_0043432141 /DNA_START=96 /DNA_END=1721 /DNA_ORIENTATION=+
MTSSSRLPDRLLIVAGTYDGVICGFDSQPRKSTNNDDTNDNDVMSLLNKAKREKDEEESFLKMSFAMAVHDGSVRCVSVASTSNDQHNDDSSQKKKNKKKRNPEEEEEEEEVVPGLLFTGGYDDTMAIFNLKKYQQAGELKSPADLGSPTCSAFAPPTSPAYVLMGTTSGKIVLYKKRDWSIQHILPGHIGGVACIAVHPSGKMALSGGTKDGKLMLWDLMRGRLAFAHKSSSGKTTVQDIIWSADGNRYAFCTNDGKITARNVHNSEEDLLDIALPKRSRANQIAFMGGHDGLFLAAACDDGSLPVFMVGSVSSEEEEVGARRAIMAIEPVDGVIAREERFKCIRPIVNGGSGFLVVTSNSGGVCSVIDLEGAARMMLSDDNDNDDDTNQSKDTANNTSSDEDDDDDDDEGEEEVAAEILTSVRIGSGARITTIDVWSHGSSASNNMDDSSVAEEEEEEETIDVKEQEEEIISEEEKEVAVVEDDKAKRKRTKETVLVGPRGNMVEMDAEEVEKARTLIHQAKKRQKRKQKKKKSKENKS